MKPLLFQFLAAPADGAPVHVRHRLKQRRIQFNRVIGFGNRELRHRRIELQLQALQQNRMVNVSLGSPPTQYTVAQNQFHPLCLALDPSIQAVKGLKYLHRRSCRPLGFRPFLSQKFPTLQRRDSRLVFVESRDAGIFRCIGFSLRFPQNDLFRRVVPPGFHPIGDLLRRFRRPCYKRALHFQQKVPAGGVRLAGLVLFCRFGFRCVGFCRPALNRRVGRKPMKPQAPRLLADLPFGRIAVLVQRFQVAEDAREFVAGNAEFIGVHVHTPFKDTRSGWSGLWNPQDSNVRFRFSIELR
jgi:hypothetical protein